MSLILGIDLSTQSCTTEVRDAETFAVVGRSRTPLPATTPPVSEHDPLDWWSSVVRTCSILRSEGVDLGAVRSMSVSGQCHALVALNADGQPIRPAKLWNDTTTAPQVKWLLSEVPTEEWVRRVGSVPTPAFTVAKLAWLLENEPRTIGATEQILLPHDYITFRLTGQFVTDRSEASGTGYFDSVDNRYDTVLLHRLFGNVLDWDRVLPRVGEPDSIAGRVTENAAMQLGVPAGTLVAVGGGDQHVAPLGLGTAPGDVVFSLGTSGTVSTLSEAPVVDVAGDIDCVANAVGGWLPLACTLNSTKVTDWAANLLGVDVQELDRLALAAPRSDGLAVFVPYLDGERTPSVPEATGVLAGITSGMGREEFAASAFYGVLAGLLYGFDALDRIGVLTDGRIITVGGGARSRAYTQFLANLLARDVWTIGEPEATVRGACVQALAALRDESSMELAIALRPQAVLAASPESADALWPKLRPRYAEVSTFAANIQRPRTE